MATIHRPSSTPKIDSKGHSVIYRLRHRKRIPLRILTQQRTVMVPTGVDATLCAPLVRLSRDYDFVFQLEMF